MSDPYYELPYISQSSLKQFMASPVAYHYNYILGLGKGVKTNATNLGSLVHTCLLEPVEVDNRYVGYAEDMRPEVEKTMASAKNKLWKQELLEKVKGEGLQLVPKGLLDVADEMVKVVCNHTTASALLFPDVSEGWMRKVELSITWRNDCSDLVLKSKLDLLLVKVNESKGVGEFVVVDYKTTSASNLTEFGWSVKKYGYDVQAAFYSDAAYAWLEEQLPGIEFTGKVLFIPQRTIPPYQVLGVVQLSYATEQNARVKYTKALQELEGCLHTDIWQEDVGIQVLDLSTPIPLDDVVPLDLSDLLFSHEGL